MVSAIIGGCASMITPEKIDPAVYREYTCEQIQNEQQTLTAALEYSTGLQRRSILGGALGGPAMAMASGWHGSQIANFKGRLLALDQVSKSKECKKDPAT
jgi:hypothetical protein